MKNMELLRGYPLFAHLGDAALRDLARIASVRRIAKGEILFHDGEEATALFLVASGAVDLIKSSADGREQLVRSVRKGELFAEAAMFSGEVYPVTAVVRRDGEVVTIGKPPLRDYLAHHPEAALAIMGVMAKLLRHLNAMLAEFALGTVSQRLTAYFLRRAEREGRRFDLGMPKRDLAFKLGTTPETLSRSLRAMVKVGVLDMRGRQIEIVNISRLQRFSER